MTWPSKESGSGHFQFEGLQPLDIFIERVLQWIEFLNGNITEEGECEVDVLWLYPAYIGVALFQLSLKLIQCVSDFIAHIDGNECPDRFLFRLLG